MISKTDYLPQFNKALAHTRAEIASLRTGRASVQMLDDVTIEAYGSRMKLNEVASLSAPDASLLVVSPWDKSLVAAIEKGIQAANLNLNPVVDGQAVKVPVPPLTQERRQEMVKVLHQRAETGRVLIRTARADAKEMIEDQKGEAGVSEDDVEAALKELDVTTKEYIEKIDVLVKEKETELLSL